MHETLGAIHFAAEDGPEGLVPETDTEHGNFAVKIFDGFGGDAVVFQGFAGSGGNDEVTRIERDELVHRDLVVAEYFDVRSEFAEVLDEVIRKRVVVID